MAWAEDQWVSVGTDDDLEAIEEADPARFDALEAQQERRWMPVYGCADPARFHPRANLPIVTDNDETGQTGQTQALDNDTNRTASAEEARLSRRVVIENNKARDAAVSVRRTWLREFFQRKTPPVGAAAFIADAVLTAKHAVRKALEQGHPLAVELFGVDGASTKDSDSEQTEYAYPAHRRAQDLATLTDGATEKRLTLITLATIMARPRGSPRPPLLATRQRLHRGGLPAIPRHPRLPTQPRRTTRHRPRRPNDRLRTVDGIGVAYRLPRSGWRVSCSAGIEPLPTTTLRYHSDRMNLRQAEITGDPRACRSSRVL